MLATHNPFFLYSQELFNCFHLFHREVFASAQVTSRCPCSWCPFLDYPFPYALLFFTKWFKAANSFFFLSVMEDWGYYSTFCIKSGFFDYFLQFFQHGMKQT